jgi:2-C-methyl-D-erythritol 4-phosphate cytidylyltransferase/2-C-methyl-D-erythritol 2,4-cyclodiphosphate synthase
MAGPVIALVVAAGAGSRAGAGAPKQFRPIAGTAVVAHAIDALEASGLVDEIHVVIGPGQQGALQEAIGTRELAGVITGGSARQESVRNGLEAVAARDPGVVLIHDAARPFLPSAVVARLLTALEESDGAAPVMPVVDTLAAVAGVLGDVVQRDGVARVQTPQAFRFPAILAAHRAWTGPDATDDAQVARAAGIDVAVVEGATVLEKLTFASDFERAEARLRTRMVSRTGLGFDVHGFAAGDAVWLGGVRIPHDRALAGHSDADVGLHAITDALLGTIAAGDIGDHFPPTDPQWRGVASSLFLDHARRLIVERGGIVDHVDLTLICEAPKIGVHREAIRISIARVLQLPVASISVKATTTERLGFTGRSEGIAAQAIATVRLPEGTRNEEW